MPGCIFDTNVLSLILMDESVPDKWIPIWQKIKMGNHKMILIAPVVSEFYYKNARRFKKQHVRGKIDWAYSLPNGDFHELCYEDARMAGEIRVDFREGLSLTDCFILAVGKRSGATIVTTDPGIKNVARRLRIKVSYIPFEECT